jgi:hypothetical protein
MAAIITRTIIAITSIELIVEVDAGIEVVGIV